MVKISVVEAAKKARMEPEEFLKKLKEFGIYVEDVQSTFDSTKLPQVISLLKTEEKPSVRKVEKRISSQLVRRRSKKKKMEPEPPATELETKPEQPPVAEPFFEAVTGPEARVDMPPLVQPETEEVDESEPDQEGKPVEPESADEQQDIEESQSAPEIETEADNEVVEPVTLKEEPEAGQEAATEPQAEQAEKPVPEKKRRIKAKKIDVRGVTKEPARILSLPDRKIETLKPSLMEDDRSSKTTPAPETTERKGKKGRKVVEVGRRTEERRSRKKEVYEKDLRHGGKKKRRMLKSTEKTTPKALKRKIKIMEEIQVGELAHRMGVKARDLIRQLIGMGVMATINQVIDFDTATIIAAEYQFEVENVSVDADDFLKIDEAVQESAVKVFRPPVVTVMGHVDHGKTTLLDAIRKTDVVDGEAGGITQHIGAYNVRLEKGRVIFLDTPGHETFTAMRARGAQVTDIVVLIVAADDGVMPQTIEAINHAREAHVPIIVAINKIDKPGADVDRIKQMLTEYELVPEIWGGETLFAEISAKQGTGITELLEMILLQAEILELSAVTDCKASGFILEARLDKGRGPVSTVLVKEGSLKVGDSVVSDRYWGKVRSMTDDKGRNVEVATPSMPVEVIGVGGVPPAGSTFNATVEEKFARQVAELRGKKARERESSQLSRISLEDFYSNMGEDEVRELKLILKADVQGSLEAIIDAMNKLSTSKVKVNVIHSGAGAISETDVNFALASKAIILGFNVRPEVKSRALAERVNIEIRLYEVIYDLVKDVRDALEGLLAPTYQESILGRVEVREVYHISRLGTIAGCHVTDGKIIRNSKCRLLRDGVVIFNGKIDSLKRFKDDAKEVTSGFECGIGLEGYNDIKVGDEIEGFEILEIASKLS